jgi:hypothetical protein
MFKESFEERLERDKKYREQVEAEALKCYEEDKRIKEMQLLEQKIKEVKISIKLKDLIHFILLNLVLITITCLLIFRIVYETEINEIRRNTIIFWSEK